MRLTPGWGLGLGGIGIGVLLFVLQESDVEMSSAVLVGLLVAAMLMMAVGTWLEIQARTTDTVAPPSASTSTAVPDRPPVAPAQTQADSFRRAIANMETELEGVKDRLMDAKETGYYHRPFGASVQRFRILSDELADRDLPSERQQISMIYNRLDRLHDRTDNRSWSNTPFRSRSPLRLMLTTTLTPSCNRLTKPSTCWLDFPPGSGAVHRRALRPTTSWPIGTRTTTSWWSQGKPGAMSPKLASDFVTTSVRRSSA